MVWKSYEKGVSLYLKVDGCKYHVNCLLRQSLLLYADFGDMHIVWSLVAEEVCVTVIK